MRHSPATGYFMTVSYMRGRRNASAIGMLAIPRWSDVEIVQAGSKSTELFEVQLSAVCKSTCCATYALACGYFVTADAVPTRCQCGVASDRRRRLDFQAGNRMRLMTIGGLSGRRAAGTSASEGNIPVQRIGEFADIGSLLALGATARGKVRP